MKERPILFSAPMVRALLDGSKTQTRRVFNDKANWHFIEGVGDLSICPYGQPGDHLWVRETFIPVMPQDPTYNNGEPIEYDYAATYQPGYRLCTPKWKPSIHMPRRASRINLEITGVRVEKLQDISEADALAEGIERSTWEYSCEPYRNYRKPAMAPGENCSSPRTSFMTLWESINGAGSWDLNPWVWVIEFKRVPA